MPSLPHRGEGPSFPYAGQPMHILAGLDGQPPAFAAMELSVPARFAGPIPHAHDEFDEAIDVLSGRLMVGGTGELEEAQPGTPRQPPAALTPRRYAASPGVTR